jgi:hypothetical protein
LCQCLTQSVDGEVGEETVEALEVVVQDALCAACLVGDSPAGQPDGTIASQDAIRRGEQVLAQVCPRNTPHRDPFRP